MSHFKLINHFLLLFIQIQVSRQATTHSELHDHPSVSGQIESELIAKEVYEDTVYYCVGYSTFIYKNIEGARPKENKITGKVTRLSYLLPDTEGIDRVCVFSPYMNFFIENGFERPKGVTYLKPYNKNYYIDIVETNNTAHLTEGQIASSLSKSGKLNVYGILFHVNSYEIQKSSGQNINSLAGYFLGFLR